MSMAPFLIMRLPRLGGPGPAGCSFPPLSLCVRTWDRQAAVGEAVEGGNRQGMCHGHPRAPVLALAQQPPKAWPQVTPQ